MNRGKRLGVRRRKLLGSRSQPAPISEAALREYELKAKNIMRRFDQFPPLQRALVNFFGGQVLARVHESWPSIRPEDIPAKLGKKQEFDEYYEEAYGRRLRDAAAAEKERIASVWDGIL